MPYNGKREEVGLEKENITFPKPYVECSKGNQP